MGWTADLTDVQKAVIYTLHKQGNTQQGGCSQTSAFNMFGYAYLNDTAKCGSHESSRCWILLGCCTLWDMDEY